MREQALSRRLQRTQPTAAIDDFANKVSDDGVVNTMKELVDYVAEHGPEAPEMAGNISTLQNVINSLPDEFMSEITEVSRTETTNVARFAFPSSRRMGLSALHRSMVC